MTISTKKMKPVEMVRLLNSTELGTVLSTAKIYRPPRPATASLPQRTAGP